MPRPGGHARFPRLVAAAVDADLLTRLDDWARHQKVTKSQLIRDLITQHVPDLRKLSPRAPQRVDG
jgi:metal-responsive CopG/Arc/MetJ family transcriptional regulator